MKIFEKIGDLRSFLVKSKSNTSVGFVPTMGALHQGHATLIEKSVLENDLTVCSIFVNPKQFNNVEDLEMYPKSQDADVNLLEANGCDVLFVPSVKEMYPNGEGELFIGFGDIENLLEGEFRPGHFSGVGVVVSKLLNIVRADRAYFGQKDLQQLAIVRTLVEGLNIATSIVSVETVREQSGLAMSSRNLRLNESQKKIAANLIKIMNKVKANCIQGLAISEAVTNGKKEIGCIKELELEYLEVVDSKTMLKIASLNNANEISICAAAHIGGVRIIDNIYIKQDN